MKNLKRLVISVKSSINTLIDEVENHEAQAESVLAELVSLEKNTRLQLHRLAKLGKDYQQHIEELQQQAYTWSKRAIQIREEDESKALQCVKRMRDYQQQHKRVEKLLDNVNEQKNKSADDLRYIRQQIRQLRNKKAILAARENHHRIPLHKAKDTTPLQDMNDVLSRWEEHIVCHENETDDPEIDDELDQAFTDVEDELELHTMLTELCQTDSSSNDQPGV